MSTPELQLQTMFVLNGSNRITSTREPGSTPGPRFYLVRSATTCAWAIRVDISEELAEELGSLAWGEPPVSDLRDGPMHAGQYVRLVGGQVESGPAFAFPNVLPQPDSTITFIEDVQPLQHHFRGWTSSEISERLPIAAVVRDGHAVSVCFCARRSDVAAEAGLETAVPFRGRGSGPHVTAAWALAIRASGRIPLYSTSWSNTASLAVARKLGLVAYASTWSLSS
jgi:hypothetical protein